ncbi:Alpha/Beta hydrolase protein [Gorgonomyces haynaldii]|nr:Alpha/Beta hydrolase protein [Gorgonomyces haynaldii]
MHKRETKEISLLSKSLIVSRILLFSVTTLLVLLIERPFSKSKYTFYQDFIVRFMRFSTKKLSRDQVNWLYIAVPSVPQPGTPIDHNEYGVWIGPESDHPEAITVFFIHGGALNLGHALQYAAFHSELTQKSPKPVRVFSVDYPLSPEVVYPQHLEFVRAAYRHVLQTVPTTRIVVMGDSAGGNLSLALLNTIEDSELPQAAVTISPWLNPGQKPQDYPDAPFDYLNPKQTHDFFLKAYPDPATHDLDTVNILKMPDERLQRLFPRVKFLLMYGGIEALAPQITSFISRVKTVCGDASVSVDVDPDMPHVYLCYAEEMYGANAARAAERLMEWTAAQFAIA